MKIDKNSYGTIASVWAGGIILLFLIYKFIHIAFISWPLTFIIVGFMIFVTWFFRVPLRNVAGKDNSVTSVADGKVVIITKVIEPEYVKKECIQISVYMDFFNVHANFWPVTGEVTYFKYHPGKYFLAFLPKASEKNEHTSVGMDCKYGKILYKQIAGTFARRIVSYAKPGVLTKRGKQCGIIKFGSRVDIYLPLDVDVKVKVGDNVKACETILAEFKS